MTKYNNQKTYIQGIKFDSKGEAMHYLYLKSLLDKGTIKNLKLQTKMEFKIDGKKIFTYYADFSYEDEKGIHYIDVKSPITAKNPVFRLKKKIIEAVYNVTIEIVM